MQLNSVYLYPNRIEVFTNSLASWRTERYRKVYNRNLKIYRGVDNDVDIRVKNSDQKPAAIVAPSGLTATLVYNIIDKDSQKIVLTKDCEILDAEKGKASVRITKDQARVIEKGFYQYSVILEFRETIDADEYRVVSRTAMYLDSQYGAVGFVEVDGDVYGEILDTVVIDKFEYINPFNVGERNQKIYNSSIVDAQPQTDTPQSWHTFQFYFSSDYQGQVIIQGSLEEQGATPKKWVDILTLDSTAPLEYRNVQGKWSWFRIKHLPTKGTLDKILYR